MSAAIRGTAGLVALALAFGMARASSERVPVAPARVLHVDGAGLDAGWYGADTVGDTLALAGARFGAPPPADAPVLDGDAVRVQDGWVLHEPLPIVVETGLVGRGDIPPQRPPASSDGRAVLAAGGRLALNHATTAELEALPGIGPALAARIVAGRPYRSVDDLDAVRGIGPRTLERLRPWVRP
jgi:competence protein ComEA